MKTIFSILLAFALCLLAPLALAQGSHANVSHQSTPYASAPSHSSAPAAAHHESGTARGSNHGNQHQHGVTNPRASDRGHFAGDQGRHTNDRDRNHFNGRHFDRDYHRDHFGYNHRFHIGRPAFYGGYYHFWYGGFWYFWYDPWPMDWCYCDDVFIDYDADTDCYFLYNRYHPGFRLRIGVVF